MPLDEIYSQLEMHIIRNAFLLRLAYGIDIGPNAPACRQFANLLKTMDASSHEIITKGNPNQSRKSQVFAQLFLGLYFC